MSKTDNQPSFSKSLFSGWIPDEIVFPYPKPDKEEAENVKMILETLHKFADDNIDSRKIDEQLKIPDEVLNGLKELGFFGLIIPEEYGGFGLGATSYARIIEDFGGIDASTSICLGAHQSIGFKGLLLFGTEEQKKLYLPKLATGEMIACYCLTEAGAGSDAGGIKTRAVRDEKKGIYKLNGSKMWISNGGISDFFTVFAKEEMKMENGDIKDKITAFIVTREMGVKSGKEEEKLGLHGSSTTEILFDNIEVPIDHVLGERGKGFKVAMEILNSGRVGLAGGNIGASKKILKEIISHIKQRKQFGLPLADFELIQQKVAQVSINIFVAESMVYLTTGLIDQGEIDCSLESAICKVYATDTLWYNVNECLQMAGGIGYSKEYPYELWLRDARINLIFEGTNEILRIFIALSGLQERGEYLKKIGKALNDPIKSFGVITNYAVHYMKDRISKERIRDVHISLSDAKADFENWAKNLHIAAERVLMRYGKDIIKKEIIQKRLADAIIDLYGMIATISRVDTDISDKGADNCQEEILLCTSFCEQAWRRIRRNILMIDKNDDENILKISKDICDKEGYLI